MEASIDVEMEVPKEQNPNIGVPLFLKKLWKMINDKDLEHIICWNETEDGFIILDQFALSSKVLPQYFKHNNMSSFVRQLHLYNFRKVQTTNDRIQFSHNCFMKGVPELLVLIRRKAPVVKQREITSSEEKKDFLNEIKQLRNKNLLINKELTLLKQENLALWSEINSLRIKHEKQLSVVNKLIHFLVSYIHSHQTSYAKQNMNVPRSSQNNLKSSPKILELDYKDKKQILGNTANQSSYSILEPGTSNSSGTITYSVKIPEGLSKTRNLQEILSSNHSMKLNRNVNDEITYSIKFPTNQSGKMIPSDLQESLFELLRENEKLSIENSSEDILTEINAVNSSVGDNGLDFDEPIQEFVPAFSSSAGNTYYTVCYPKEHTQNIQSYAESSMQSSSTGVLDESISAPAEISNTIKMYTNMSGKPESTQILERSNKADFIYHNGSRRRNEISELASNIYTSVEIENDINSPKLVQSTPSGAFIKEIPKIKSTQIEDSKQVNQSLLELLIENECLTSENLHENALEIQQKSPTRNSNDPDIFSQKNVESMSPLIESPDIGIEYIVEAPDSNSNPVSNEMECSDILEITQDEMTDTVNSISPSGSKDYDALMNPLISNLNEDEVVGLVSYPDGNEVSHIGSRHHALNKTKKQNYIVSDKNIPKYNSLKMEHTLIKKSLLEILKENMNLSTENLHNNKLGLQENTIVFPSQSSKFESHVENLSQTNCGQIFPDVDSSEIGTDYIVHATDANINRSNVEIKHAKTLEELLKVAEPKAETSEISALRDTKGDPNSLLRKVYSSYRTDNEVFPIKNKFGLGKRKLQQNISTLQTNKAAPNTNLTSVKNSTYSRNTLQSASNETTLRSFKIPKLEKKEVPKVERSLLKPRNRNTIYYVSHNPIQMPSVSETKYTVQAPNLKSTNPLINENLPNSPTRNSIPPEKNSLEHKFISDISKQKPGNTNWQTNETASKKRSKAGANLRSQKTHNNESVKMDAKVQESILEILNENESSSDVNMLATPENVIEPNIQAMRNLELMPHDDDQIPTFFETPAAASNSNFNPLIDGIGFTEILENNFDNIGGTVESIVSNSADRNIPPSLASDELNSLETPNSYSETSQEDLSILQDFLNSFNSKDLKDIVSIDTNFTCPEDENHCSHLNLYHSDDGAQVEKTSHVDDQYFSPHLFQNEK